jgi:alkanesulfonate monooxygenase SsuD/methylene tetrahydromethanopterin reductase-like flavin-dependent oxidoreductase (luciferase family)
MPRDAELACLEKVEKDATTWRRAQELRAFADALKNVIVGTKDERAEKIAWILNAADGLDPLVKKYWPALDI